ncbi:MAG: transcription antitermination factor NusB [Clostridia bacterium]|nr:transcription antitermination factor NusB [Clostridia bacterium]
MSRKSAREAAFKTIFEISFHTEETPCEIISFAVDYQKDDLKSDNDKTYFKKVTTLCYDNLENIDKQISKHLKNDWTLERLSRVNLSIIRLAACEMIYMTDIPYQVSINEAVELAKKFGDDDSPAFINGILAPMTDRG